MFRTNPYPSNPSKSPVPTRCHRTSQRIRPTRSAHHSRINLAHTYGSGANKSSRTQPACAARGVPREPSALPALPRHGRHSQVICWPQQTPQLVHQHYTKLVLRLPHLYSTRATPQQLWSPFTRKKYDVIRTLSINKRSGSCPDLGPVS